MNKILIVDDSATMRKIIKRVLRQSGLEVDAVLEAGNGAEALTVLKSTTGIDLILSDVNMPEMNGLELVCEVRKTHTADQLPIFMITTEGGEEIRNKAMTEGANGYITKPFTPDSIAKTLQRYVA